MKKYLTKHLSVICSLTGIVFMAMALVMVQSALAADAPAFGDSVLGLINAIKVGAIGAILLAAGQLLKSDVVSAFIAGKINTKFIPWLNLALAIVISLGAAWGSKPWYISVAEGVMGYLAAAGTFDLTKAKTAA